MKKLLNSTQKKIILGATVIVVILGIIFGSQLINKGQKDVYEMQIKYLGGNPDVLKLNMPHTGSGVEISVKKNGEIIKTFDMNESSGKMNLPDLNVEEYDYSKVSYLMTQSQFETDHDFKKGSYPDWQAIAEWHLSNMNETKPFERKAQYLSEDGEVLAEGVIQYIVVDEEVPYMDTVEAGSQIKVKKGENNLIEKFQEHMDKVKNTINNLEYTDSFEGNVDVNVPGSYPIVVTRTAKRNGLVIKGNFTIIVEEEVATIDTPSTNSNTTKPSTPSTNNNTTKPSTPSTSNDTTKPSTPSTNDNTSKPEPSVPQVEEEAGKDENPKGMLLFKQYANANSCIDNMNAELKAHYREWHDNFCASDGKMFYTPR